MKKLAVLSSTCKRDKYKVHCYYWIGRWNHEYACVYCKDEQQAKEVENKIINATRFFPACSVMIDCINIKDVKYG